MILTDILQNNWINKYPNF